METSGDEELTSLGNTGSSDDAQKRPNQYIYWSLTWNNYPVETMEIIFPILRSECDWFIIQEELGESKTPHLQGTLKLKKKKRLSELKRIHAQIHWEVTQKIHASAYYCSNIEKRHGKIWTHNFTIPEIIKNDFQPYGWQLEIIDIIKENPHPRMIHWYWSKRGGVGKSDIALWLYDYKNALLCMGKSNDIFHLLSKEKNRRQLIVFDITKDKMEHFQYSTLESIKNGYVVSGKYDSCAVRFNRPHIIVFANTSPDKSRMTEEDRWHIVNIESTMMQYQSDQKIQHNISNQLELTEY